MKRIAVFICALLTSYSLAAEPTVEDATVYSVKEGDDINTTAFINIRDDNVLNNPLVAARTSYAQLALVEKPNKISEPLKNNLPPIKGMTFKVSLKELLKPIEEHSKIDLRLTFKNGEVLQVQANVFSNES